MKKVYTVEIEELVNGVRVSVIHNDDAQLVGEGFRVKQYQIPHCVKDIFSKEFPAPEKKS